MKTNLTIMFIFFLFSCGGDNATNPATGPNYHSDDDSFITELVNLNTLEMDSLNNRITVLTVGSGNEKYDRIVMMDLSNLGLENLPTNIKNLEYLEELDISNNSFSDLPSELCEISKQLNTLKIEKNLLCDPTSIAHCVLEEITVDFNEQNCTLIKETQEMQFLLKFIRDNSLDSISSTIFNDIEWSWTGTDSALTSDGKQIERIIEIRWIDYGITKIPGTIQDLIYLKQLELEDNELVILPTEMKYLISLRDLQVHNNKLIALPEYIGDMDSLRRFDGHNNMLTELPESIGNLEKLDFLNVSNNQLATLSDTLCGLINSGLQINIECNQLDSTNTASCFHGILGSQGDHPNCSGN